jgi:hypothetical protein
MDKLPDAMSARVTDLMDIAITVYNIKLGDQLLKCEKDITPDPRCDDGWVATIVKVKQLNLLRLVELLAFKAAKVFNDLGRFRYHPAILASEFIISLLCTGFLIAIILYALFDCELF